ncbi:hypothetical protein V8G54_012930 [Vigna mungo]|uniref:Uncharacterized protein n=1 Tax=Vigna mungo TaxID=3915 RepID=A0AAQ3S4G8_VIGMU
MLNSKTTTTVRIAQTEYRLTSSKGFLRKIRRERRMRASPIFAENMIFLGSDIPISHARAVTRFVLFHAPMIPSETTRYEQHRLRGELSSSSDSGRAIPIWE